MIIDKETCIACGNCAFTCTVGAIHIEDEIASIDRNWCVECGVCLRDADCPTEAIQQDELVWPRIVRKYFSDNQFAWPEDIRYTTGTGRGTEECKTNDRTGRFKRGEVGMLVELGRPGIGTFLYNAEKIIQTLIEAGAELEEKSTIRGFLTDQEKGILREELKNERVLSCIVEAKVPLGNLEETLNSIKRVTPEIDTVFTLGLITRMENGFVSPIEPVLNKMGLEVRMNSKLNLGMGKPLCED
jgi:ferredoxin